MKQFKRFTILFLFVSGLLIGDISAQAYQFPETQGTKRSRKVSVFDGSVLTSNCNPKLYYYRFREGDKVEFNISSKKNKKIKSIRIVQYPNFERYTNIDCTDPLKFELNVPKTGIYFIEIIGNHCLGAKRKIRLKIDRQPLHDSCANFNCDVQFRTVVDSSEVWKDETYLVRNDTAFLELLDQTIKISSQNALNGNSNLRASSFNLPEGTVSWSYYIGVGQKATQEYDNKISEYNNQLAAGIAAAEPMTALLLYGINRFLKVNEGDNVRFWISSMPAASEMFVSQGTYSPDPMTLLKQGDVINDASRMNRPAKGQVHFLMLNDNIMDPIQIKLVVKCMTVTPVHGTRRVMEIRTTTKLLPIE